MSGGATEPHSLMVKVGNRLTGASVEQLSLTVKWGHPEVQDDKNTVKQLIQDNLQTTGIQRQKRSLGDESMSLMAEFK